MLILRYPSKKDLATNIGQPLLYTETSMFGPEYTSDGVVHGSNRPHITGFSREFFAAVTLVDGLITKVK